MQCGDLLCLSVLCIYTAHLCHRTSLLCFHLRIEHTEWSITCLTLGEQKSKQKVKMTEKCVHLQVKPLERIMICSYFVVMATAT